MTIGGTTRAVNAGKYTVTFTPKTGYQWSDGSTTARNVTWEIGKAQGNVSANLTGVTVDFEETSKAITISRTGDGEIMAVSGDESMVTVSVLGTIVTVSHTMKKPGNTEVKIWAAEGANYDSSPVISIPVTVGFPSAVLAENSPKVIATAAKAGIAKELWNVGDTIPIAVNGTVGRLEMNGTYRAVIIGFDHNSDIEGKNTIHFQFGKDAENRDIVFTDDMCNRFAGTDVAFSMKKGTSGSNSGGWKDSDMRNVICPQFFAALPQEWQDVIIPCTKYTNNKGKSPDLYDVNATHDKIWLLALREILESGMYIDSNEANYQKKYNYYSNGNPVKRYDTNGKACVYWTRSANKYEESSFAGIDSYGEVVKQDSPCSYGFSPCFAVGSI